MKEESIQNRFHAVQVLVRDSGLYAFSGLENLIV